MCILLGFGLRKNPEIFQGIAAYSGVEGGFLEGSGDQQCQIYGKRRKADKAITIGHPIFVGFIAIP